MRILKELSKTGKKEKEVMEEVRSTLTGSGCVRPSKLTHTIDCQAQKGEGISTEREGKKNGTNGYG